MSNTALLAPSFFHVDRKHIAILHLIDAEDGEIAPHLEEALAVNDAEFKEVAISFAHLAVGMEQSNTSIDTEIKRLQTMKKKNEGRAEAVRKMIAQEMIRCGLLSIDFPLLKLSLRKSKVVVIDDEKQIPQELMKHVPESYEVSKTNIAAAYKAGRVIAGAHMEERNNLQIK